MPSFPHLPSLSVPVSPEFIVTRGGFNFQGSRVPYFSANIPIKDLVSVVRLPAQLPFSFEEPVRLSELFQRELDRERVRTSIVDRYLKNPEALRFFPSLTVVLLPVDPASGVLLDEYQAGEALAPPVAAGRPAGRALAGLRHSYEGEDDAIGLLSWNTDAIFPVLLDGQHRFWALKTLYDDSTGPLRVALEQSSISVLLLVLDKDAGFAAPEGLGVLAACRQLFRDLNQHARAVSDVRVHLLNDESFGSVAARTLIADAVSGTTTPITARVAADGHFPLATVDWQGETAKIDSGHALTSVLILHDIARSMHEVPEVAVDDSSTAKKALETLFSRLGAAEISGKTMAEWLAEVDEADAQEMPFQLPRPFITEAAKRFHDIYGARIARPLAELAPYATLVKAFEDADLWSSPVEPWFAVEPSVRPEIARMLNIDGLQEKSRSAWEPVKRNWPLAYQVVFQKALIKSCNDMLAVGPELAELWQVEVADLLDEWINRANAGMVNGLRMAGVQSPFYGTGILLDGRTDKRKASTADIAGLMTHALLADSAVRAGQLDPHDQVALTDWVQRQWGEIKTGFKPPLRALISSSGRRWRDSLTTFITNVELGGGGVVSTQEEVAAKAAVHAASQLSALVTGSSYAS